MSLGRVAPGLRVEVAAVPRPRSQPHQVSEGRDAGTESRLAMPETRLDAEGAAALGCPSLLLPSAATFGSATHSSRPAGLGSAAVEAKLRHRRVQGNAFIR